jgi:hypothetical protein
MISNSETNNIFTAQQYDFAKQVSFHWPRPPCMGKPQVVDRPPGLAGNPIARDICRIAHCA